LQYENNLIKNKLCRISAGGTRRTGGHCGGLLAGEVRHTGRTGACAAKEGCAIGCGGGLHAFSTRFTMTTPSDAQRTTLMPDCRLTPRSLKSGDLIPGGGGAWAAKEGCAVGCGDGLHAFSTRFTLMTRSDPTGYM
jgi:hypothetical protein